MGSVHVVIAFASTNIDDLFVLMLFFGNKRYTTKQVVIGQYLGIISLVLISLIGSLVGIFVGKEYIGLLGFIPMFLGIRMLMNLFRNKQAYNKDEIKKNVETKKHGNIFSIAAVTFANGGDNIGVYVPLFASLSWRGKLIMVSIFLFMIALWCLIGKYLSKHPAVAKGIDKYGHFITPIVLILLGMYILYESGSFALIHI